MKTAYWQTHYVVQTDPAQIAAHMSMREFVSRQTTHKLTCFITDQRAPNILISQGTGGGPLIFAEFAYRISQLGFNVFIMPRHGGATISELAQRHQDALNFISQRFGQRIGVYGEGLGGFVLFYVTLAGSPAQSAVYQNAPAILTEKSFKRAVVGKLQRAILGPAKVIVKMAPRLSIPISLYLNWKKLIDTKPDIHAQEQRLVESYLGDPDFNHRYPLKAVLSLLQTPPPKPLATLSVPTLFTVARRGFGGQLFVDYLENLFARLPMAKKELIKVDGSVFWMVSHPQEAAALVGGWFKRTLVSLRA